MTLATCSVLSTVTERYFETQTTNYIGPHNGTYTLLAAGFLQLSFLVNEFEFEILVDKLST
jgi:hypothetical protein